MTEIDQLFADWDEIDLLIQEEYDGETTHHSMNKVNHKIDSSKHFKRGDYDGHGWTINGCIRLPHAKDDI